METFKTIVGYDDYEISNFGRIKTKERMVRYVHARTKKELFRKTDGRFMKVYENNITGYKHVVLRKDNKPKTLTIHTLVAKTFIQRIEGLNVVNHIDGNKHNNCIENLEWCDNKYNHEHATRTGLTAKGTQVSSSKLNEKCIHAIIYFLDKGFTHTEIAKAFDVSRPTITLIHQKKSWKHVALIQTALTQTELKIK